MTCTSGLVLIHGRFAGVYRFTRGLTWDEWSTVAFSTSLRLAYLGTISRAERLLVAAYASSLQLTAHLSVRSREAAKEEGVGLVVLQLGIEGYKLGAVGVDER
jgi:hypothetical protein